MLRGLQADDDLRFLRRAVALLRNLENFEVFRRDLRSCDDQPRRKSETDKHIAYNEYLAPISTNETSSDFPKARRALINDLCLSRRWLLLAKPLTTGAILICGQPVSKKLSVAL